MHDNAIEQLARSEAWSLCTYGVVCELLNCSLGWAAAAAEPSAETLPVNFHQLAQELDESMT
jgi:hypothetical protein